MGENNVHMSGELTKRIQETEISSFHDVNNAQDELDTRITEPLEKLRKDIIAKRIECKVLLEEAAAAERLHKMLENRSSKYFLIQCWCEKSCLQQWIETANGQDGSTRFQWKDERLSMFLRGLARSHRQ